MRGRRPCPLQGFLVLAAAVGAVSAEDLIDMRQLGTRGAVLETPVPSVEGNLFDAQGLGDVNGDGFDDLGVIYWGEPSETGQPWRYGVVYGRRGLQGRNALDELPETLVFRMNNRFSRGGGRPNHLHPVGDLNGDGFGDFMVGFVGYRFTADQRNSGAAFLVYGGTHLVGRGLIEEVGETIPGVRFWSSDPTHFALGSNYRIVGDFNGDGREDLAISAPTSDVGIWEGAGVLFVLFDTRDLPSLVDLAGVGRDIPGLVIRGTTLLETPDGPVTRPLGQLGTGIEAAGDFDGDGFDDFLVSTHDLFTVYLVRGSAEPPAVIDLGQLDEAGFRRLGITAFRTPFDDRIFADCHQSTGIGDIDGDGRSEIIVGVSRRDARFGRDLKDSEVYLFRGREEFPAVVEMGDVPSGLRATVFRPRQWGDLLGITMAPAGDLNGDSVPDFLVGAPRAWRDGLKNVGEAYAVFSRPDFPLEVRLEDGFDGIRMLGEGAWQLLGARLSSAGDFNGDGNVDVISGASYFPPAPPLGDPTWAVSTSSTAAALIACR